MGFSGQEFSYSEEDELTEKSFGETEAPYEVPAVDFEGEDTTYDYDLMPAASLDEINEPIESLSEGVTVEAIRQGTVPESVYARAERLPAYRIEGDEQLEALRQLEEDIEDATVTGSFPGEAEPTSEEQELMATTQAAMVAVGLDVGIDMRARLLRLPDGTGGNAGRYHLFCSEDEYQAVLEKYWSDIVAESEGYFQFGVGILVPRQADAGRFASVLLHEGAHAGSQQVLAANSLEAADEFNLILGYSHVSVAIADQVVDMMADRGAQHMGLDYDHGDNAPLNVLADGAIWEAAANTGRDPRWIEDRLIYGSFTGDMTGIRQVAKGLGDERWNRFLELTTETTWEDALQIAQELDLQVAVRTIERYKRGEAIRLYAWRYN